MGFLQRLLFNQREKDLLDFIASLQEDKQRLLKDNEELKQELKQLINNIIINSNSISKPPKHPIKQDLTPKEREIYNFIIDNVNVTYLTLINQFNIKESSLKVTLSRIRTKGYSFNIST